MSYGREIETEITIERELVYARAASMAEKGIWETKDGRKLNVRDMTDSHIANCLAMLERGGSPYADPFIVMFENEKKRREKVVSNQKRRL